MKELPPQDSIVVLQASLTHTEPGEIVASNIWFVNALFDEYLTAAEIATDALRSYYVDYYLAQVNNGGYSQFVYNSRWSPLVLQWLREGMEAMGATRHLEVFEKGAKLVGSFGQERLEAYFASEYFGENSDRDELNAPNDDFVETEKHEDLLSLNAAWLRGHSKLHPLPTEDEMRLVARRRGEMLPNREHRIAEARAEEPRYIKLIRELCEHAGQELVKVTAGDPSRVHNGIRSLAWHFITDKGHHHMVEADGRAIMFRGHSTTDQVCDIEISYDH